MSNTAQTLASGRIAALLDENSFVEIGAAVTARATDFNMNNTDTPSDGVITGYYSRHLFHKCLHPHSAFSKATAHSCSSQQFHI